MGQDLTPLIRCKVVVRLGALEKCDEDPKDDSGDDCLLIHVNLLRDMKYAMRFVQENRGTCELPLKGSNKKALKATSNPKELFYLYLSLGEVTLTSSTAPKRRG